MVFDKRIENGQYARRPDILIRRDTYSIVIECDENQHHRYDCENRRVMEIFSDLGNKPLICIRFNPDSYITEDDEKVSGCFGTTKKGSVTVKKIEWNKRITKLLSILKECYENPPEKELVIYKLFYDGF
jgi:hypothetical protein